MVDPLQTLKENVPSFMQRIRGKIVYDYGCGTGDQAIAMAKLGADYVVGYDPSMKCIGQACNKSRSISNLSFTTKVPNGLANVVISLCSMEHFKDPYQTFDEMANLVKPGGSLIISFGPLWHSPYGAHMDYFLPIPWVHLLLPEAIVMGLRSRHRKDGAKRYVDVERGLNQMTVSKFEHILKQSGMNITYLKYDCVKKMNIFKNVPILRELFINQATVVLEKHGRPVQTRRLPVRPIRSVASA